MVEQQSSNLVHKLNKLETFKSIGLEAGLIINEGEIEIKRKLILRSFYDKDRLAYNVSIGLQSYVKLIEPIEERYNSLWKKATIPKKNPKLEEEMIKVFTSMNNVGVSYISNIDKFTYDRRKEDIHFRDRLSLTVGASFSALMYLNIPYSDLPNYYNLVPLSFIFIPYLILKPVTAAIKYNLKTLHQSAEETDKYLRKNTI